MFVEKKYKRTQRTKQKAERTLIAEHCRTIYQEPKTHFKGFDSLSTQYFMSFLRHRRAEMI